ncbi:Acetyltransferase (GNAT) domain-containing protein [Thiocapsa roseopersicina]|uniref:Acetyltransferase (GNAT) domain-containing protein n=2 Tax=Thiocapsa roseopersicina TaxID=1058 RepID=A0A1H3D3F0_THIRO|nr:Acetyltransferase (GNAT) domain-containing protein [Thiocapsa roseopersicina]
MPSSFPGLGLMKLRSGSANDAEAIAELIASFQSELTNQPDGAGAEQYLASVSSQSEREYLESPRYAYIVAELDGDIRGFIALRDVSHVFHLFVARQYQRTGIARRLWREAKTQALKAAAPTHFTVNSSLSAVATYRAFGFEASGEVVSVHGISFVPMRLAVHELEG